MIKENERNSTPNKSDNPVHQVRLPRFVADEDIGLGDVIKRATSYIGIKPCGGCEGRASALNRWMAFTGGKTSLQRVGEK